MQAWLLTSQPIYKGIAHCKGKFPPHRPSARSSLQEQRPYRRSRFASSSFALDDSRMYSGNLTRLRLYLTAPEARIRILKRSQADVAITSEDGYLDTVGTLNLHAYPAVSRPLAAMTTIVRLPERCVRGGLPMSTRTSVARIAGVVDIPCDSTAGPTRARRRF